MACLNTRRVIAIAVLIATLVSLAAINLWQRRHQAEIQSLDGWTMGSTWSVKFVAPADFDTLALRSAIEAELGELDRQLSGYRDSAELSILNRTPVGEWRELPPHLSTVIRFGQALHADTDGAFDLTVKPLVNLWGFGVADPRTSLPTETEILAARARLGSDRLEVSTDGRRARRLADVTIDVDSVAPGHAADVIAAFLTSRGLPDHLVDIGGELKGEGMKPDGAPWRVGIERPVLARGDLATIIEVRDTGLATSGDYRDFVEIDGRRYSHTIDPVTGRPVEHGLSSVTVLAPTTLAADGYATALMVLGPDRGMAWADARGLAVYMIVRDAQGALTERYNAAFATVLVAD